MYWYSSVVVKVKRLKHNNTTLNMRLNQVPCIIMEYAGLDGMVTIKTIAGPWEVTVGPVNKGFHATLNASFDDAGKYGMLYLYNKASISVSKVGEPFVQKAYDEEAHPIKLYCIVGD